MMFGMLTFSHRRKSLPRVEDPADKVVNRFGLGESLMTTFMCDNPDASTKKTGEERVECPDGEFGECVEVWARKGDVFWSDQCVKIFGYLPGNTDGGQVTNTTPACQMLNCGGRQQKTYMYKLDLRAERWKQCALQYESATANSRYRR